MKYTIECKPHLSADPHWYWDSNHATFLGAWLTLWSRRWSLGGRFFSFRIVEVQK